MKKRLILASSSPRRQELFHFITSDFEILSPDVDENIDEADPIKLVELLAEKKASAASELAGDDAVVLGADTVVVLDDHVLGKPIDEADAKRMLRMLSGRAHVVCTGFCLVDNTTGKHITESVSAEVVFNEMTDEEIDAYVKTKEPMDKAGAYGIQGYGSKYISIVNGNYFTVMGFPVSNIYNAMKTLDCL